MLIHHWAPVQLWLRSRFHVILEVLNPRIYTVAAKIVDGLVLDIDGNFVKAVKPMGDMKDVPAISQMMSDESTVQARFYTKIQQRWSDQVPGDADDNEHGSNLTEYDGRCRGT